MIGSSIHRIVPEDRRDELRIASAQMAFSDLASEFIEIVA